MSTVEQRTYTPEDLLVMPEGKHFELVDGELVETSMSALGGWVTMLVGERLSAHVRENNLGIVMSATTSYQCFPDDEYRVRRPDLSFVQTGRMPPSQLQHGHVRIAPDLVVEIVSPNDLYYDVEHKVGEYLSAGVRLVWVFNPDRRNVRAFGADGSVRQLSENEELSGDDVLPGFHVQVGNLFPAANLN